MHYVSEDRRSASMSMPGSISQADRGSAMRDLVAISTCSSEVPTGLGDPIPRGGNVQTTGTRISHATRISPARDPWTRFPQNWPRGTGWRASAN
eukprot:408259-Pyramimonas_sp.AAC.1